jgi:tetratricopeptide (TPR) repeat protein
MKGCGLRVWVLAACLIGSTALGDRRSDRRNDLLRRGQLAREDGFPELSEQHFAGALELSRDPEERVEALLGISEALLGQRRAKDALARLEEAASASPTPGQRIRIALLRADALDERDPAAALKIVQDARQATPDTEEESSALAFAEARLEFRAGRPDAAVRAFEAGAARNGGRIPPGFALERIEALEGAGRTADAETRLRELAADASSESRTAATIYLGDLLSRSGRFGEARSLLEPLVQDASHPEAWAGMARIFERENQPDRAVALLDQAAALTNLPPGAVTYLQMNKGRLLLQTGRAEEGQRLLREAILAAPDHPQAAEAQLDLARHLFEKNDWESARAEYQRYLESTPVTHRTLEARMGRAACLHALKRYSEAAAQYEQLAAEPSLPPAARVEALRGAARAWNSDRQLDTARSVYRKILEESPGTPAAIEAEFQIAETYRAARDWPEARRRFAEFRAVHPDDLLAGEAQALGALAAEEEGDRDGAYAMYSELVAQSPKGRLAARALFRQGLLRYQQGSFEEAIGRFEAAVAADPGSAHAEQSLFMQAGSHSLAGRTGAGLEIARRFLREHPGSVWIPQVELWIAEALFQQEKFAEAEETFARLGARRPAIEPTDDALYWAGRSALRGGNALQALAHFGALLSDLPESPLVDRARLDQGDALRELGKFNDAILAYEEILKRGKDRYLCELARIRLGDCHFILAPEEPARYELALTYYKATLDEEGVETELAREAGYKTGRCLEARGELEAALKSYLEVLHDYSAAASGSPWVSRAGLAAGANLETRTRWPEAAAVYERLIRRGGPAAEDAQARLNRIRREQWGRF